MVHIIIVIFFWIIYGSYYWSGYCYIYTLQLFRENLSSNTNKSNPSPNSRLSWLLTLRIRWWRIKIICNILRYILKKNMWICMFSLTHILGNISCNVCLFVQKNKFYLIYIREVQIVLKSANQRKVQWYCAMYVQSNLDIWIQVAIGFDRWHSMIGH